MLDTDLFANKFNIKKIISSVTTFALNETLTTNLFNSVIDIISRNGSALSENFEENISIINHMEMILMIHLNLLDLLFLIDMKLKVLK